MSGNIWFKFRICGTVFAVSCQYPTTKLHCQDFLVSDWEPAAEEIDITPADIEAERAYLTGKKNGQPLEASTPESLEILVVLRKTAERMPLHGGLLFHGSALAMDGSGILFTAASGTGKSTHAALWRRVFGSRVVTINDDKPFLSADEGGIRVYGSPWQGKHRLGENTSAPVKAICILCRGETNSITRVSHAEALPMLLQQTYRPRSPRVLLPTMQFVDRMSREIPIYRLCCNMDPEAAWVAWQGITSTEEEI